MPVAQLGLDVGQLTAFRERDSPPEESIRDILRIERDRRAIHWRLTGHGRLICAVLWATSTHEMQNAVCNVHMQVFFPNTRNLEDSNRLGGQWVVEEIHSWAKDSRVLRLADEHIGEMRADGDAAVATQGVIYSVLSVAQERALVRRRLRRWPAVLVRMLGHDAAVVLYLHHRKSGGRRC